MGAGSQQGARGLDQIAGPDEVIAADVVVALGKTPGDGEARDDATPKPLGLVGAQGRRADPVEVARTLRPCVEREQRLLPAPPAVEVLVTGRLKVAAQTCQRLVAGFERGCAEPEGQQKRAAGDLEVHLGGKGSVAVLSPRVLPGHPPVRGEVLPAVGDADEPGRALRPRHRACESECTRAAFGEEHRDALIGSDPGGVAVTAVAEVRGQEHVHVVLIEPARERHKPRSLEHRVSPWLSVNQTRLIGDRAVATALFALEVQRGGIPGQPGAYWMSSAITVSPAGALGAPHSITALISAGAGGPGAATNRSLG